MSKIGSAINEIQTLDNLAREDRFLNRIDPFVKLVITVLFVALTVSFGKYNFAGLISMAIYPLLVFNIGNLSFKDALRRLRVVLPLVCIVGVFNPIFDRQIILHIGSVGISGGVVSMVTLMIKAVLTVLASYLLIATTPIEGICRALRRIHVPQIIVTEILLIYRYVSLLLSEARRVTQAYSLRAPGQKGVAFRVWGSLLGQMLLRSMDRAGEVYESMCLRGFRGEFYVKQKNSSRSSDILYLLIWAAVLILLRRFPVLEWIGSLFVR